MYIRTKFKAPISVVDIASSMIGVIILLFFSNVKSKFN